MNGVIGPMDPILKHTDKKTKCVQFSGTPCRKDCARLEKGPEGQDEDASDKEVDIGTDITETDQHSPGKSYLFQFFSLNNNIKHWKSRRHCRLDDI